MRTAAGALGIGVALAGAPGPVQAVLMSEAVRGGVGRGFRALAGVHATFAALLVAIALGVSLEPPSGWVLRALRVAGGLVLVALAADGIRTEPSAERELGRRHVAPALRGSLAILLNPPGWLFLAAVASPLLSTASHHGGVASAIVAAAALVAGAAAGDAALVVLGGAGVRRTSAGWVAWIRRLLAAALAVAGVWLIVRGVAA